MTKKIYWVYVDRVTPFINTAPYWKGFDSYLGALLYMKINQFNLLAVSK